MIIKGAMLDHQNRFGGNILKDFVKFGFLSIPLFILAACGTRLSNDLAASTPSGTVPPSVTPTITPSPTAVPFTGTNPMEVILNSQYETGGPSTTEIDCVIPPGTSSGNVSTCNPIIPEGRLHFSTLTWTVNVGLQDQTPGCEIVVFKPYYYQASSTANFLPSWETAAVDCSASPIITDCFSGVGTLIVPSFPQFRGVYFLVQANSTQNYSATSANLNLRGSNRWTVNNLANHAAAHTFSGGSDAYIGSNNYVDYQFTCNDRYMQPVYTVNMQINDMDIVGVYPNTQPGNSAINQYPDWNVGSWDY
jgi:hypothetical protein